MAIHTEKELRHELSHDGQFNNDMIKQMFRVLLDMIDERDKQIKQLQFDLVFQEEKTKGL